jgi:signal transduction histidine kinase
VPGFAEIAHRNRTVITVFVLIVLLPAGIFTALMIRAVRSERLRADYQRAQRQKHIIRLVEADLNNWLFSTHPESALSKAVLRFQVDGDRIVFPEFRLSLPSTAAPHRLPLPSTADVTSITRESIVERYHPRIQAFLRDLNAGRNSGAQFFLRLKAVVVRLPGREEGYVLDAQPLIEYLDRRLAEFCAAETFSATVRGRDFREATTQGNAGAPGVALGLEGFPFFEIVFRESHVPGVASVREHAFAYSMAVLFLVTVLGSIFLHRAVSHDVRLSHLRTDFVAAVSHEFRSPLSSILALSERLESSRVHEPEKLAQYHGIIGQEARRLNALVTRLLNFAQIEEGKKVYSFERVDLASVAQEAVHVCRDSLRSDRIHLGEPAAPLWVHGDGTALRHCIQNVIENGAKYSALDAPVTITCTAENGFHVVEVRDAGIGIPSSEQRRIFEKFYRGTQAAELNGQGIGIGLALVKQVIDSHGGSIVVDSQVGRGTRFRMLLPRAEA